MYSLAINTFEIIKKVMSITVYLFVFIFQSLMQDSIMLHWSAFSHFLALDTDTNPDADFYFLISVFLFLMQWFVFSRFDSVTVPEKLDCFITRYAEHIHEKWCIEKVCMIFILLLCFLIILFFPSP